MKKRIYNLGIVPIMTIASIFYPFCVNAETIVGSTYENQYLTEEVFQEESKEIDYEEEYINHTFYNFYVVSLLNDLGINTNIDEWENNLKYIKENYNTISKIQDVNMDLVDYYIMQYDSELQFINNMFTETDNLQQYTPMGISTYASVSNFSTYKAVEYAIKYYNTFNPNYPNWTSAGGDCANFISQCLVAGGRKMEEGNANSNLNWFSYGNKTDTTQVSSSFRGANAFKNYFYERAKKKKLFLNGTTKTDLFNYVKTGDAISFCKKSGSNYIAQHTMIVVAKNYNTKTIYLAAHTNPTKDAVMYNMLKSYDGCYVFSMK